MWIEKELYDKIKQVMPILCVEVLIFSNDGAANRVLLARRAIPPDAGKWAPPGGGICMGEGLEGAARRELLEETGLKVQRLHELKTINYFLEDRQVIAIAFWGYHESTYDITLSDEHDDFFWFSVSQLPDNLHPLTKQAILEARIQSHLWKRRTVKFELKDSGEE